MITCQMENKVGHGDVDRPASRRVTVEDQQGQQTTLDLCPVCYGFNVKRNPSLKIVNVEPIDD